MNATNLYRFYSSINQIIVNAINDGLLDESSIYNQIESIESTFTSFKFIYSKYLNLKKSVQLNSKSEYNPEVEAKLKELDDMYKIVESLESSNKELKESNSLLNSRVEYLSKLSSKESLKFQVVNVLNQKISHYESELNYLNEKYKNYYIKTSRNSLLLSILYPDIDYNDSNEVIFEKISSNTFIVDDFKKTFVERLNKFQSDFKDEVLKQLIRNQEHLKTAESNKAMLISSFYSLAEFKSLILDLNKRGITNIDITKIKLLDKSAVIELKKQLISSIDSSNENHEILKLKFDNLSNKAKQIFPQLEYYSQVNSDVIKSVISSTGEITLNSKKIANIKELINNISTAKKILDISNTKRIKEFIVELDRYSELSDIKEYFNLILPLYYNTIILYDDDDKTAQFESLEVERFLEEFNSSVSKLKVVASDISEALKISLVKFNKESN